MTTTTMTTPTLRFQTLQRGRDTPSGLFLYSEARDDKESQPLQGTLVVTTKTTTSEIGSLENDLSEISLSGSFSPLHSPHYMGMSSSSQCHIFTDEDDSVDYRSHKNSEEDNADVSIQSPTGWAKYNHERGKNAARHLLQKAMHKEKSTSTKGFFRRKKMPWYKDDKERHHQQEEEDETETTAFSLYEDDKHDAWETRASSEDIVQSLELGREGQLLLKTFRSRVIQDEDGEPETFLPTLSLAGGFDLPHYDQYVERTLKDFSELLNKLNQTK